MEDLATKYYDRLQDIINSSEYLERIESMKEELLFYYNAQWTNEEATDMEDTGQTDIVLNTLRRAIRALVSQLVSSSPSSKFMPVNWTDEEIRQTLEQLQGLFDHCWYISKGNIEMRRAITSQLVCGLGWLDCYLDPEADYYRGELKFRSLLPWEVVVPLSTKNFDFSDAREMFICETISVSEAIEICGSQHADQLRREACDSYKLNTSLGMKSSNNEDVVIDSVDEDITKLDDDHLMVAWTTVQRKVKKPAYLYKIILNDSVIDTVVYDPLDENLLNKFNIEQFLQERNIQYTKVKKQEIKVNRIEEFTIAGRSVLAIAPETLPISNFHTVPLIDEDTWNPLCLGETFFIKGAQKLLNSVFSLAVKHLQTSGSGDKLIGFKGSFGKTPEQVENFQNHYAQPTSATELAVDYEDGANINNLFTKIPASPLQPAAVQVMQILTGWIDRLIGVSPLQWGDTSAAPRTLGATLSIKEWGDENGKLPALHIQDSLQTLGNVWWEWSSWHYTYPKKITVPNIHGQFKSYEFNQPTNDGRIINDMVGLKARVFITSGASLMMNRQSILMMFRELMQVNPLFTELFLLYTDLPDKFEIIDKISYIKQLEQTVQQMQQQLEQYAQVAQQSAQEADTLSKEIELVKFDSTLKQAETKYRSSLKENVTKHRAQLEKSQNDKAKQKSK